LHIIHENGAQNLQVTRVEFSIFLAQNSDNANYMKAVGQKDRDILIVNAALNCCKATNKKEEWLEV